MAQGIVGTLRWPPGGETCAVVSCSLGYADGEYTIIDSIDDPGSWGLAEEGPGGPPNDMTGFPTGCYNVTLSTDYGGTIDVTGLMSPYVMNPGEHGPGFPISILDTDTVTLTFYSSDGFGPDGDGPTTATFTFCPTECP